MASRPSIRYLRGPQAGTRRRGRFNPGKGDARRHCASEPLSSSSRAGARFCASPVEDGTKEYRSGARSMHSTSLSVGRAGRLTDRPATVWMRQGTARIGQHGKRAASILLALSTRRTRVNLLLAAARRQRAQPGFLGLPWTMSMWQQPVGQLAKRVLSGCRARSRAV
jgi:hypothetical protein